MNNQQTERQKMTTEEIFNGLLDYGFPQPQMFLFLKRSFQFSTYAKSGLHICYGGLIHLHVGPQNEKTPIKMDPSLEELDIAGINPWSVTTIVKDFADSKIRKDGLAVLIDGVWIRIGPQKSPKRLC